MIARIGCIKFLVVWLAIGFGRGQSTATAQPLDIGRVTSFVTPNSSAGIANFSDEMRLRVSFREHPAGLEVAAIHSGPAPVTLVSRGNQGLQGEFELGDVVSHLNGVRVANVDDLFGQLRRGSGDLPMTVIDVKNNQSIEWIASPSMVRVAAGLPKARADGSGRVHVLHAVATNDPTIGQNIIVNRDTMKKLVENYLAAQFRGVYRIVEGAECSAKGIVVALSNLVVGPQDTLLVYYQGHGAYDDRFAAGDPASGHFFDFTQNDLLRKELLTAMQAKGARLTILISDACNVRGTIDVTPQQYYRTETRAIEGWTTLEELLLCYRGVLDLSSASQGQLSWCTRDIGGWFTSSFINSMESGVVTDRTWNSMWSRIKKSTEDVYSSRREKYGNQVPLLKRQLTLAPQEFVWNIQRDDSPARPTGQRFLQSSISADVP